MSGKGRTVNTMVMEIFEAIEGQVGHDLKMRAKRRTCVAYKI